MIDVYELSVFKVVTIANGASLSNAQYIQGYDVVAIQKDATLAGTALTFQASLDGVTFANLFDASNTEVSCTTTTLTALCHVLQQSKEIRGINSIKLRSGTSASPTSQSADINVQLGLRYIT